MQEKYCPQIHEYITDCFTQCQWFNGICGYDPLIIKEMEDLKAMRQAGGKHASNKSADTAKPD
jgi:hypothetical protein